MSDPRLYWSPDPDGSLEEIDLAEGLTDFQEVPALVRRKDAYNGSMLPSASFLGGSRFYRITLERFGTPGSSALERKLLNMETHLQRGGYVGFSRDHAKTWAAVNVSAPTRGDIVLHTGTGNGFKAWSPAAVVVEGDEMVLESPPAEWQREFFLCGLTGGGTPPTKIGYPAPGVVYTYSEFSIVRWRDFLPVLRLPESELNRPYVPHDHRRSWTLNLVLEYNPAAVIQLWQSGSDGYSRGGFDAMAGSAWNHNSPALRGTGSVGSFGSSVDSILGTSRALVGVPKGRG